MDHNATFDDFGTLFITIYYLVSLFGLLYCTYLIIRPFDVFDMKFIRIKQCKFENASREKRKLIIFKKIDVL